MELLNKIRGRLNGKRKRKPTNTLGLAAMNFDLDNHFRKSERLKSRLAKSRGPIAVGPFYSEVGYELIYWYPYINWLLSDVEMDRVHFVGRGQLSRVFFKTAHHHCLVEKLGRAEYMKIIEMNSKSFSASLKQKAINDIDAELIQSMAGDVKISINARELFRHYKKFYQEYFGRRFLGSTENYDFLDGKRFKDSDGSVVVKLYNSSASSLNEAKVERLFKVIQQRHPKAKIRILVSNQYDDHEQFIGSGAVGREIELLKVPDVANLEFQADVLATAGHFYTNYGGMSYLGPMLGVNTTAIADNPHFWYSNAHFMKFCEMLRQIDSEVSYEIQNI